jgi:endonuclease/exonuclease/phosphatase family metal-dependent hydrolase
LHAPAPAPAQRIRIATFNIQNFGKSKVHNAAVLSQIIAIVQDFDVIAIQEVSDKSGEAMKAFQKALDPTAQTFQLVVSDRTGRQPDDQSSQEQYAFVFRKDHLQLLGTPELYPDTEDAFQREPFLAHFKCVNGNFSFVLINIHTQPERAVAEIGALDSVMHWAKGHFPGEDDFIALGDFNGSCNYAKPAELNGLKLRGPDYVWIVPDDADTNLAQIACAYDRIVITRGAVEDFANRWEVDRVFNDKKISDHWPVWAEFFTDHDHNTN